MLVAVSSHKGGCGKSVCAIHIAAYLHTLAPTLLVDSDINRSAYDWSRRSRGQALLPGLPFPVVTDRSAAAALRENARQGGHAVFDSPARLGREDLEEITERIGLLIVPTLVDALSLAVTQKTVADLQSLGFARFKVLLNAVAPRSHDGIEARAMFAEIGVPVFAAVVRRYAAYQKAALQGVVVADVKDPKAAEAWSDFVAVGAEIVASVPQEIAS